MTLLFVDGFESEVETTQLTHAFSEAANACENMAEAFNEAGRQMVDGFQAGTIDVGDYQGSIVLSVNDMTYAQWLAERKNYDHKAEVLLMSLLNRRQKKEYKQKRQISIYEGRERKWILRKQYNYNIVECENGRPVRAYCVQTDTPLADQLATQFLYLKHSPQELLDKANIKDYGKMQIYHFSMR